MLYRVGQFLNSHRYAVIIAWLVLAGGLKLTAPSWTSVATDGDLEQLPADTTSARAARLNRLAFPEDRALSSIVLVFAREGVPLIQQDRQFILAMAKTLSERTDLPFSTPRSDEGPDLSVWTERTPVIGPMLKNESGSAQRVVVQLTNDFMATDNIRVLEVVEQTLLQFQPQAPAGLAMGISGSAAIGGDMLSAASESLRSTHLTTLLLVFTALMLIYRSPRLVVIPLLVITLSASVSLDLLALMAEFSQNHPDLWPTIRVFTTTKIFVIVLLFGAGTDYCLFLIARFRELLDTDSHRVESQGEAVAQSLDRVGLALAASALTTVVGLTMMGFAEFGKFAYSGPAIAVSLLVTLVVCLTLAPALLSTPLAAPRSNGAAKTPDAVSSEQRRAASPWWNEIAQRVTRRPGVVLAASLLVALPLAWHGWSTPVSYDLYSELPSGRISRQGTRLLQRHFPPGELGPLTVLAFSPDAELDTAEGRIAIARLVKPLTDLPGVAKVRSLDQPTGDPPGTVRLGSVEGLAALAAKSNPQTKAAFVSTSSPLAGEVTRLRLVLDHEPFSAEAVATCDRILETLNQMKVDKESDWYGATFELSGPTAGIRDLENITQSDRRRIEVLVAGAVFLVLLLLLRRPLVCCYLIFTVVVSYLVTLGLISLIFQSFDGYAAGTLLTGEVAWAGVNWKVPVFLFVILTAVGQDYNIYLVTRVFEEQRRLGPIAGLRKAVVQTGSIITSCGLIMAGTFVSMMTGSLRGMIELGAALSLGIVLDTFVVRTILVPAFLALLARRK
ncbi:MMPL family transporter [Adhaeretor mobilis]|uniref:MMPL family transporter n=1 Tax=Adhaeretor mobilis TaxID=1930276 RepID=UPI001C54CD9E|nr:MMPL family transporter [Adhaeretor mobilis]